MKSQCKCARNKGEIKRSGFSEPPKGLTVKPKNKDNFNDFSFKEMITIFEEELTEGQHLVLCGGFEDHEKVVYVFSEGTQEVPELFSTQDEAGTRLWLHVKDAAERFGTKTAIIWSPDADVLVIGIHIFRTTSGLTHM